MILSIVLIFKVEQKLKLIKTQLTKRKSFVDLSCTLIVLVQRESEYIMPLLFETNQY